MAAPPNVEMEAAKFLHKLIQESKDEPTKLATKLHVILQHMRSSGKENSMPYQVISRAMETVINQHGLDIDALTSSRTPLTTGTQVVDSASSQFAGSSLGGAVAMEANTSLASGDLTKTDSYASNRPPVGPSFAGHDIYQGSGSHLNSKSLDHESPSSFDTRSAKSHSEERHDSPKWEKAKKKDNKKGGSKRKKADPSSNSESQFGNIQPLESSTFSSGMDKAATKVDQPRNISIQGGEHGLFSNMVQSSSMMEHNTMRSALRAKQEIQHQAEKSLDSTNISNSLSRTPHSRHPEEIEVSSAHNALSRQQGVSLPVAHDVLNTRGTWNQTKTGTPFEKSQVPRFSFNTGGVNSSAETLLHQSAGAAGKVYGMAPGTSGAYATTVPGLPGSVHFSNTYDNLSLGPKMNKDRNMEQFSSASSLDLPSDKGAFGKALEFEGGSLHTLRNDSSVVQGGMQNNVTEMAVLRNTGKLPVSQSPSAPIMPFKEQHLKQLRAQCLVYLAFRNGLKPKKLHLDFALGNFLPKEEGPSKDMVDQKGKEQLFDGTSNTSDVPTAFGRLDSSRESENLRLDPSSVGMLADVKLTKGEYVNMAGEKNGMPSGITEYGEESRQIMMARRKPDSEMQTGEVVQSQLSAKGVHPDGFSSRSSPRNNHKDDLDNRHQQVRSIDQASSVMGMGQQLQTEVTGQSGNSCDEEASNLPLQSLAAINESVPERKNISANQSFSLSDRNFQGSQPADAYLPSFPSSAHWKSLSRTDGGNLMVSPDDSKISHKSYSGSVGSIRVPADNTLLNGNPFSLMDTVHEEEDVSVATDMPPSPKYTTTEKWIIDRQKRKLLAEKTWALKQQRTHQRITACSDKLKDNVSSSEDISAKTRSVIELKKLQLLELQRRLRKDILNDFFRPIASDMDRLKSIKKHRIGRRSKQLEKYEQKMKEERQKRFRERQKEFFSEIEIHKERLEDVFKMRRERWKGFNRSVREFHKRKERIHREKIDRIQREKINLLKINDVEGYLRMVQDAKSDRVKQLLKETEKYLQKLGSKLRDAKAMSRCFETDMDDTRSAGVMEKNETVTDNEDETDQAKHYLESNEKYYLMAHSIKETVAEQPSCLVGGKLREYQMNGLRWLVSLYNNHLNGILADEMGLGKTVQVISLICYLMENKNDRGPFLVVVPSSVLPGWDSEINFWAPSINKIVYSGPPEERRRLFKERIVPQKFNVLLTTYEYLMNKHDRPKLSKIHWHYVIIDEGHRIKNASCKLNADLKLYHSSHRLLLTGTPLQNNLEELWALLNFLLPNIFNSSEDFSQWFNKPFESNGDSSPDEALLSEEENLLIINRLHQVLRPFVLRRLKHKVENELPEKIERLVRCEASAYQKLLMKRVEDNLGALGTSKARSVHNSVMELRNICNHPYLSQLHSEEVHDYIPKHYLPNIVRLCGKLEMLDRILPKLKATDHRVLLFSTMTRLLDVMEDYLYWKQYKYLRLDGHTSGGDRGALIDQYNKPDSPYFIFLLSIRAGGVGVNLQAADTVIIFDTDWNPQVDLQAQARAHRIGQKREVLVLRFETVQTVEEQVRAAAEHKLGVANQSITAGFFDNNTSAEDRREYLESLLRESKKEEAAPVLHDDAVNDLIARSESEIDIFESIDKRRQEEEMAAWKLALGGRANSSELVHSLPSRLVTSEELKTFSEAMKIYDAPSAATVSNIGIKRKGGYLGGLDTQHYGRGKRAREVRSYEEQWTEDEFEKLCQAESPHSPKMKDEVKEMNLPMVTSELSDVDVKAEMMAPSEQPTLPQFAQSVQPTLVAQPSLVQSVQPLVKTTEPPIVHSVKPLVVQSGNPLQQAMQSPVVQAAYPSVSQAVHTPTMQPTQRSKEMAPKRGRGRPKRVTTQISPNVVVPSLSGAGNMNMGTQTGTVSKSFLEAGLDHVPSSTAVGNSSGTILQSGGIDISQALSTPASASPNSQPTLVPCPIPVPDKRRGRKGQSGGETPRRRGRKPTAGSSTTPIMSPSPGTDNLSMVSQGEIVSNLADASVPAGPPVKDVDRETSSVSPVPVLLPSKNIKPQDVQVSSSCILSNPSVPTGISVKSDELHAGTSIPEPNVPLYPLPPESQAASVGTDTSSQQNPRLSSVTSVPQSVSPSQVVPKQVKGRGSKAQSEGETPRRRGRKPSTAVPGGSGGQELTSTEPPQKKSRVSSGKMTVASRRMQQNETLSLVNVIQTEASEIHTSDSVVGPGSSNITDRPSQSVENNQPTSSTIAVEVAARSPSREFANVKVSQFDVPVSGDGKLLTKVEACQSSVEPVGIELCKSPIKNVGPAIEATGDTQSSEYQSPRSESIPLTQSTYQALGTAPLSDVGIVNVQPEESSVKVDEITNASLGATQGDTLTDISENQNLDSIKFSVLSNMETSIATQGSGDTSNLALSNLETDQASDAVNVGSPYEKKCGGKLEEVPQVDVFVQDVADANKLSEESLGGKDVIQHVSEKSVDTKDCVVHVTEKAVNYVEGNVVEADDAMVETRESINSYEAGASLDKTGHDLVGSSGEDRNTEIIAGAINVAASDADCSAGFGVEKFILVNPCSLTGCAGEEPERTVEAAVAPEYNTTISDAKEKSEVQYEAKDLSEPKHEQVDKVAQDNMEATVDVGQNLEEPYVQCCQTQTEKEFEASEKVEPSDEQLQTRAVEDSEPSKMSKEVPGETTCDRMNQGDNIAQDNVEVAVEVGQNLEELSDQQCHTQIEEEFEASEKVELSGEQLQTRVEEDSEPTKLSKEVPGETTCDRMDEGDEVMQDNVEITVEVGYSLEEPSVQRCETPMEKEFKASEVGQSLEEPSVQQCQTLIEKDCEASENVELSSDPRQTQAEENLDPSKMGKEVPGETTCDRMDQVDEVVQDNGEVTVEVGHRIEEPSVQQCQTLIEKNCEASENVELSSDPRQTQAEENLDPSKMGKEVPGETTCDRMDQVDEVVQDNGEVTVEVGHRIEEPSVQQCQTLIEKNCEASENVELSSDQRQTQAEENPDPSKMGKEVPGETTCDRMDQVDEVVQDNREVTVEVGHSVEEPSVQQCQTLIEKDCEASEKLSSDQRQTQAEENSDPSKMGKELPGETTCDRMDQVDEVVQDNVEVTVEVGHSVEEPSFQHCETQMEEEFKASEVGKNLEETSVQQCQIQIEKDCEASQKVDLSQEAVKHETSKEQGGEIIETMKELPGKQYQAEVAEAKLTEGRQGGEVFLEEMSEVPGKAICDRMNEGDEVDQDNVEAIVEVEQNLEEPSIQKCQTQTDKEIEASEKVELSSDQSQARPEEDLEPSKVSKEVPEETPCDEMGQGDEVVKDNVVVTVEVGHSLEEPSGQQCATETEKKFEASVVGQSLEEPSVQQCQTMIGKDCEESEKVDLFQGAGKHVANEKPGGEFCQMTEELPGEQCQTKVAEANLTEAAQGGEVLLEEISQAACLLQGDRVLDADSQTGVQIVQNSEVPHMGQYPTQGLKDFGPSDKAEILPEAAEYERREELAAREVHASEQCQTRESRDSEPYEKVEFLLKAIDHERKEDTAEMENKDMDDGGGENVAELGTKMIGETHQSPEEEGALTGCTEDSKKGGENVAELDTKKIDEPHRSPEEEGALMGCTEDTKKDEVQFSTGGGEGHEDPPTEHVAE